MNTISIGLVAQPQSDLGWLAPPKKELLQELLSAYRVHRGSKRHEPKTIKNDERNIVDFLRFAGGVPGEVKPEDFERWSDSLYRVRRVAAATQRTYQGCVRVFFDYLLREPRLRQRVRQALGEELVQVATPENCIVHLRDRELERRSARRSFTAAETDALLTQLDLEIRLAHQQHSKSLHSLQRDKVVFCSILEMGLRAGEALGLDIDSFEPNPKQPRMGPYGMCRVYGKGGVWRSVTVLNPTLPKLLHWYLEDVRPCFLANSKEGEKALFLSEQGKRLSYSALNRAWGRLRERAGLPDELVTHCLRHTSVSNNAMFGVTTEGVRIRHGHRFQATTQGYTHFPDSFIERDFSRAIKRNLDGNAP